MSPCSKMCDTEVCYDKGTSCWLTQTHPELIGEKNWWFWALLGVFLRYTFVLKKSSDWEPCVSRWIGMHPWIIQHISISPRMWRALWGRCENWRYKSGSWKRLPAFSISAGYLGSKTISTCGKINQNFLLLWLSNMDVQQSPFLEKNAK